MRSKVAVAPALASVLGSGIRIALRLAGRDALLRSHATVDALRVSERARRLVGVAALRLVVTHRDLIGSLGESRVLPDGVGGVWPSTGFIWVSGALVAALAIVLLLACNDVTAVANTIVGESRITVRVACTER